MHPPKDDLDFSPTRPRCPRCQMRLITTDRSEGPEGFEHRTLECLKCGHTEKKVEPLDPLKSDAAGWTRGDLQRPVSSVKTYQIRKGRLVLKNTKH